MTAANQIQLTLSIFCGVSGLFDHHIHWSPEPTTVDVLDRVKQQYERMTSS